MCPKDSRKLAGNIVCPVCTFFIIVYTGRGYLCLYALFVVLKRMNWERKHLCWDTKKSIWQTYDLVDDSTCWTKCLCPSGSIKKTGGYISIIEIYLWAWNDRIDLSIDLCAYMYVCV